MAYTPKTHNEHEFYQDSSLPIRATDRRIDPKSIVKVISREQLQERINIRMDYLSSVVAEAYDFVFFNKREAYEDLNVYKANRPEINARFIRKDLEPQYSGTSKQVSDLEKNLS
jgi:hypothetical protein